MLKFNFTCRKINILDNMIQKLEKYANNLEEIVQQRTSELIDEKKKTDMLLYRMLPPYVFMILINTTIVQYGSGHVIS